MDNKPYSPKKAEYNKQYNAKHLKRITISFYDTNPESVELMEIWSSIPNKAEFFKQCLRDYRDSHKESD